MCVFFFFLFFFLFYFNRFSGFVEVRMIPGRPDIAFVEFESELMSTVAKDALQGFRLSPTDVLHVAFAKK